MGDKRPAKNQRSNERFLKKHPEGRKAFAKTKREARLAKKQAKLKAKKQRKNDR